MVVSHFPLGIALFPKIGLFTLLCFSLGALPLTRYWVRVLTQKDLTQLGTGNVGVSAAFIHAGMKGGVAAGLTEIARGIAPVLLARYWFPNQPAWELVGLIALVAGRYWIGKGGGVTNVTWGLLVYSPAVVLTTGLGGLMLWRLGVWISPQDAPAARQRAVRWACAISPLWVWTWHQWPQPMPLSTGELLAAIGLAGLLILINLRQVDDLELYIQQNMQQKQMKQQHLTSLDQELDSKIYGKKAACLSQLKGAGFAVPMGWILPALTLEKIKRLTQEESSLGELPIAASHFPLIVRSSALEEDSESNSAAGQYDTIGPVSTQTELATAIHQCRQSYGSEIAISYRQQRQLSSQGIAVLIQPYIQSQFAGVLFSRNPLDGAATVVIEALPGGAEAVVGGQKTPIHLEVNIGTVEAQAESLGKIQNSVFPQDLAAKLVEQGRRIEGFYHGLPQDIEWGWDGETLWIFQARPITNLRPIWTRTIAAEVIPGAIRPLTWSINRPLTCGVWGQIFTLVLGKQAEQLDFTETATLLGSHAYFNATLLGEIFRMMGLPEQGLEFLLRGQKMGKPPLKKVFSSLPGLLRLVQKEIALVTEFKRDRQAIFLPEIKQLETENQSLNSLNSLALSQLLARSERIQAVLRPITYYNILGPIGLATRRGIFRVPDAWLPTETAPEVASIEALQKLADQLRESLNTQASTNLSELEQELSQNLTLEHQFQHQLQHQFQDWLSTYGYLSEVGTDIAVLTWQEQPETFKKMVVNLARNSNQKPEKFDINHLKGWQRWRLQQCYQRTVIKGQISEIYGKLLAHLRWTLLAIEAQGLNTGIFQQAGDIFFLEFPEIQQWILTHQTDGLLEKIQHRRQQFEQDTQRSIPNVVYGNFLPELQPELQAEQLPNKGTVLAGIPASIGCVEGTIQVLRSLTDAALDGEKQILVVPYTDAGWAPLLFNAKAIIAEVGGQLSHGAIIAREYGIPAVMNIANATTYLKNGQSVRVDGYRGTVEILEAETEVKLLEAETSDAE